MEKKAAYDRSFDYGGPMRRRHAREIELMQSLIDDPAASTMTDAEWNELCNKKCGVIAARGE